MKRQTAGGEKFQAKRNKEQAESIFKTHETKIMNKNFAKNVQSCRLPFSAATRHLKLVIL